VRPRQFVELGADRACEGRRVRLHLADDFRNDPLALLGQRQQQVFRQDLRISLAIGQLLRGEDRFLCFLGVLIDIHCYFSNFANPSYNARCSFVNKRGSCTSTVAYKSPRSSGLPTAGMPCPFNRNT